MQKKKNIYIHVSVPWYQAQFWRLERCKLSGARTTLQKCFVGRGNVLIIPRCVTNAAVHSHVWLAHSKKTLESQPQLMCTNHLQSFSPKCLHEDWNELNKLLEALGKMRLCETVGEEHWAKQQAQISSAAIWIQLVLFKVLLIAPSTQDATRWLGVNLAFALHYVIWV